MRFRQSSIVLAFVLVLASCLPALAQRSLIEDLRAERAKYGATMNDDECAELVNAVAWKNRAEGWGVSGKDFGKHGRRHDGVGIAHDVLHHQPSNRVFDVLIGAGAQSTPTWNDLGPQTDLGRRPWVAPIAPRDGGGSGGGGGTGGGGTSGGDVQRVLDAVAQLRSAVEQLNTRYDALFQNVAAMDAIVRAAHDYARDAKSAAEHVVAVLDARPTTVDFPVYSGSVRLLGQRTTITLTPQR